MDMQDYPLLSQVNVKQGTASTSRFSNGNTLPLTQLPWGMAAFIPQTQVHNKTWYYHPSERSLEGVRLTHQPSPWIGDFGSLILLPQCDVPEVDENRRWSGYRPEDAVLCPHYMKLHFLRSETVFELSPVERGAMIRITSARTCYLSLLSTDNELCVELDREGCLVTGWTNSYSGLGTPNDGYRMYFVLKLDQGYDFNNSIVVESKGVHLSLNKQCTQCSFAISFISKEQALCNLEQELAGKEFDDVFKDAANQWEKLLGRIQITTNDSDLSKTFYSCLYRTFLYPTKMYEFDEEGKIWHYDSYNDCVRPGKLYTNNGFWDTYRTVYPLYSLIAPDEYREIIDGFLQHYLDSGWLPKWPALVEIGMMSGTLLEAVFADAAVKGIMTDSQLHLALEAMVKNSTETSNGVYGRKYSAPYLNYGYIPAEDGVESVCNTLDYAYGDYCIARVAETAGEVETMMKYDKRSQSYRNLFDVETGFFRAKKTDGKFKEPFNQFYWGGEYTEGGPWQSSFAVLHDIEGLANMHGGKAALVKKLEELFSTPPKYCVGGYGFEIHEMTEMAAVDFGQCAISNQPSFSIPWMFAALDRADLTEFWTEKLVREAFSWKEDGFPGDEDNGTTSAWYIFAVLGMYPICPGKPKYIKSKQLVDNILIKEKKLDLFSENGWILHAGVKKIVNS